jgi:hypothetical protein
MDPLCRLTGAPVHSKENAAGRMSFQSFLIKAGGKNVAGLSQISIG